MCWWVPPATVKPSTVPLARPLLEASQEPAVLRMQQKGTASPCHASSFWRLCPLSCAPPLWDISSFLSIESIWKAICGRSTFFLKTRLDLGWEPRAGATLVFGKMLTHDLTKQPQTRGWRGEGHLQLRSRPKLRTDFCHEYHFPGGLGDRRGMEIMPLCISQGRDLPHWRCHNKQGVRC